MYILINRNCLKKYFSLAKIYVEFEMTLAEFRRFQYIWALLLCVGKYTAVLSYIDLRVYFSL